MQKPPRIILLLEATRGFDRGLLSGIARYSALNGPWTFYRRPQGYESLKRVLDLRELKAWKPDGAICPVAQVDKLSSLGVPLIAYDVNAYSGRVPHIVTEDSEAGRLAARHLLDLGHHHFAFYGYGDLHWSRQRCRAFRDSVEGEGGAFEIFRPKIRKPMAWEKEEPFLRKWLDQLSKPVGILCANDDRAVSILEICRILGYGVPEDISVIGVDDDRYVCELQNPPLSSVQMASTQAGYEAAALLDRMIHNKEEMSGQQILARATGIAARQSTNVLMVRNPGVRKALRFIRENAGQPIRVADIVKIVDVSHRTLNNQFYTEFGCSVRKKLTQARIAHISRLLIESEMPIHEIAKMVGYEDDRHFSRYFKRATGLTPQTYRRDHTAP